MEKKKKSIHHLAPHEVSRRLTVDEKNTLRFFVGRQKSLAPYDMIIFLLRAFCQSGKIRSPNGFPHKSMQGRIKSFGEFWIGVNERDHLLKHHLSRTDGVGVLFNLAVFCGIAKGVLGKKHVIIAEIQMKDVGRIHATAMAAT
ncbi:MAG: hypothetical protein MUO52_12660, partial [Desulfobacterales bacterium]|nr:hypothetical protein [Desulfobacterales bacterium]